MRQSELTKQTIGDMKARLDGLIELGVAASPADRDEFIGMIVTLIESMIDDAEAAATLNQTENG